MGFITESVNSTLQQDFTWNNYSNWKSINKCFFNSQRPKTKTSKTKTSCVYNNCAKHFHITKSIFSLTVYIQHSCLNKYIWNRLVNKIT